ncbi:DUF4268 domain-containing protein [Myroides sp. JBRI-B21084]|uniref:DUF4268 domain-containing protein n=1 Tax=Myroides sp. JBRI-B21084 TaxID=3119977 RepID=UPI0026E2E493|nr:DUF4268 domain-containing protein [Paenimyroides cloacae]WKW45390.1 DUF4268 domain-containing protein [Paenimyroides cloacae]
MFSKEEALQLKKDFWTGFANEYPRKWLLHNTKIKDVTFKFFVDNKTAQIALEIEPKEDEKRKIYFEKVESLKTILLDEYLEDAIFERNFYLPNGKLISRIWVDINQKVSVNNKATWPIIYDFFAEKMTSFELFFYEYEDYIKDLEINT